jgi:hypothetical protein
MVNPNVHEDPAALKALQDAIYRDKVLRARAMTGEQRLAEGFELTNGVFRRMLEGAMWQLGIEDIEEGWGEVRRRMERLSRVHDGSRFKNAAPVTQR